MQKLQIKFYTSQYITIFLSMLLFSLAFIILAIAITYKYYFRPKAEIQRYQTLLRSLGYTVYVHPFKFFGLGIAQSMEQGRKLHNDSRYFEKTVYPQVDVTISNILDKISIFLVNPDLLKEFYSGNTNSNYQKHDLLVSGVKAILGEGLFFSEGDSWKKKRKLLSKVFSFDLIKENISKMVEICDKCFDKYEAKHQIDQKRVKFSTMGLSASISNGVMMKCFFGHDHINATIGQGKNYAQFIVRTTFEVAELTQTPLLLLFGKFAWNAGLTAQIRSVRQKVKLMREKATQILRQRTEQVLASPKKQKCTDIIEALIYEKINNNEQFSYSDSQIIDEFQTFNIAGTDTTTRYFTMIIYFIQRHPQIQKRVRQEVDAVIKSDEDITYENLKKLTYIDWIQYETTRIFGPVNGIFFRIAKQDNYIKDVPIAKETLIGTQPIGNHWNPKYFKDPHIFRPERWEKECDEIHPFAFMGFSAGLRSCIGKQLAHLETKITLVKLLRRYEAIEIPKEITYNSALFEQPEKFEAIWTKKSVSP